MLTSLFNTALVSHSEGELGALHSPVMAMVQAPNFVRGSN
jgi:hypothetical protein